MKITSKDLFAQVKKQHETTLAAAFKSGNPEQMAEAMTAFFDGMNEAVLQKAAEEIDARNQDAAILSARGANVLTADERAYYEGLAAALKASDPRAAVANYEVAMPQTVIERIIGTIKKTHPLLDKLNFVSTAYLSRILVNAKPAQLATWGKITGAVQKEIEGGVQEIALTMCKLSAFLCISMDLVELGPEWMDAYARETLSEAIACACEAGAVAGTGKDEPIGMIRDMAADVSPTTGYAKQTPVKVAISEHVANLLATIENPSSTAQALRIVFAATGEVTNPFLTDVKRQETLQIGTTAKPFVLHNGEVVTVTTSLSNMHIMLASRGVQTEITNKAVWPVAWLKLHPGENLFRYGAASGEQSLQVQIWHRQSYGGA